MKALNLLLILSLLAHFAVAQCSLSFTTLTTQLCEDNGTFTDETDDFFSALVEVEATNGGTGFVVSYVDANGTPFTSEPINYGSGAYLATNLPANGNPVEITVLDYDGIINPACFVVGELTMTECSGFCQVWLPQSSPGACNDNGTGTDLTDDFFYAELEAIGINSTSGMFEVENNGNTFGPFPYSTLVSVGPFPADGIDYNLLIYDTADNTCTTTFVANQAPCSFDCAIEEVIIQQSDCDDGGTPDIPDDDTYSVCLTVNILNSVGNSFWIFGSELPFGDEYPLNEEVCFDLPCSGFVENYFIMDSGNEACSQEVEFLCEPCSDLCVINVLEQSISPCNDNGTSTDALDDLFNVNVTLGALNGSGTFNITTQPDVFSGNGNYNEPVIIPNLPANDSEIILTFTDSNDPACTNSISVAQSPCSSECTLDVNAVPYPCEDNNTPGDPTDDFFAVDVLVTPVNGTGGTDYNAVNLTSGTSYGSFPYGATAFLGNIPANGIAQDFQFVDVDDPSCQVFISFSQGDCSPECTLNVNAIAGPCNDNGTPVDFTDDIFTAEITATVQNGGGVGYMVSYTDIDGNTPLIGPVPYGVPATIMNLAANGELIDITISDFNGGPSPVCFEVIQVSQNACGDPCSIMATATPSLCDNNGTPTDPTDDFYGVEIEVTVVNGGWSNSFMVEVANGLEGPFSYADSPVWIDGIPADGSAYTLTITDVDLPDCSTEVTISNVPCSFDCELAVADVVTGDCNDNGTPQDPDDDIFSVFMNVWGVNTGDLYTVETNGMFLGSFPYGVGGEVILNADGSEQWLTVCDFNDTGCCTTVAVVGLPCSDECFIFQPALSHATDCANCDGSINLDVSNGTGSYTFDWADIAGTDDPEDRIDLCPGDYSVTVTDLNGCTEAFDFAVGCPPVIENATVTDSNCSGSCDGTIDITASDIELFYEWSNSSTTEDQIGLCPGDYNVTVTNAFGLTTTENYTVFDAPELVASVTASPQTCVDDGTATVMASGGAGLYTYLWDTPENHITNVVTGLAAGTYSVTVTDANGCTAVASVTINPPFDLQTSSTPTDCEDNGGTATVSVSGTVNNPEIAWSNGATESTATDLTTGWYSVTVTDPESACYTHENVEVVQDPTCSVLISGYVFNDDILQNCMDDGTLPGIANIMLFLDNGDLTYSGPDGYFEFQVEPGSYTVSLVLNTLQYEAVCTDPIAIDLPEGGTASTDNNFFLKFAAQSDLVVKVVKGPARPGFEQWVRVCAMNFGDAPMDGTVNMYHDPLQTFSTASPSETGYNASEQLIQWDFTNLNPGDVFVYHAYLQLPPGVAIGTMLNFDFEINPVVGDINPADNFESCFSIVTNAYDPNDKQVTPAGYGEEGFISPQDSVLNYTIRFQNTGNDTAFTVVLRDTLDPALDIFSVVPFPAEHEYTLDVLDGHVLEFTFKDILLPDSTTNEPESHGFVFYKVKLNNDLPFGTTIENRAGIYFDYNVPIITNTTINTLVTDPVWPGDADKDSIVSQYDLLHLGIGFGSSGPVRSDAGIVWQETPCLDWPQVMPESSVNYKHLDTDGSGTIDASDVVALEANWGLTVVPGIEFPEFYSQPETLRELFIELESTSEGTSVSVPVMLGTADNPVMDVYGLAFSIKYDTALIEPGSISLNFEESWLGDVSENMLAFQRDYGDAGNLAVALTRTDGTSLDGFGQIARLDFIIQDDILLWENEEQFVATTEEVELVFTIKNVKMIDEQERLLSLKYGNNSAMVMTSTDEVLAAAAVTIFPNPSSSFIKITTKNVLIENVQVFSVTGQLLVDEKHNASDIELNTARLNDGTYIIKVETQEGVWRGKLLMIR